MSEDASKKAAIREDVEEDIPMEGVKVEVVESRYNAAKLKEKYDALVKLRLTEDNKSDAASVDDDHDEDEDEEPTGRGVGTAGGEAVDDDEGYTGLKLGFLEKPTHALQMRRDYFPSKFGGLPAWLDPKNLPPISSLVCQHCHAPLRFLLQIYAPVFDDKNAFHRTLFVFACESGECLMANRSIKTFRCQLPRHNPYLSPDPPVAPDVAAQSLTGEASLFPEFSPYESVGLCRVCGLPAPKRCSACRCVHYCSLDHQIADWKAAHATECPVLAAAAATAPATPTSSASESTPVTSTSTSIPSDAAAPELVSAAESKQNTSSTTPASSSSSSSSTSVPSYASTCSSLAAGLSLSQRTRNSVSRRKFLYPSMEIVIEDEYLEPDDVTKQLRAMSLMQEYDKAREGLSASELAAHDKELEEDLEKITKLERKATGPVSPTVPTASSLSAAVSTSTATSASAATLSSSSSTSSTSSLSSSSSPSSSSSSSDAPAESVDAGDESATEQTTDGGKDEGKEEEPEQLQGAARESIDPVFVTFQHRVECNPDQILRYVPRSVRVAATASGASSADQRLAEPLWVSSVRRLMSKHKIPACPRCKGPREFEFQIMPQLLYFMGKHDVISTRGAAAAKAHASSSTSKEPMSSPLAADDGIDFGTLAVYTCRNNCVGENVGGYVEEFVHVQPAHM